MACAVFTPPRLPFEIVFDDVEATSRDQLFDDVAINIGEAKIATGMVER